MNRRRLPSTWLGCALCALVGPSTALAQSHDPATAEALFRQAREALARGDYATACPKFAESQRLDPGVGTLMNMAECEEHEGRLATAWEHWHEAIDQLLRTGDERVKIARDHATALEPRVPHLVVRLAPSAAGARVQRDDVELGRASLGVALPVDPGLHRLTVTMQGHKTAERSVDLSVGQSLDVTLDVGPVEPAAEESPGAAGTHEKGTASTQRTLGFVALGVGGAALATAIVSGLVVVHEKSIVDAQCNASGGCSAAGFDARGVGKTWLAVNTVSSIVTIAAAGLGVALVLTSGSGATTSIAPTATGSGGGLSLQRSF